jgi:UDP-glucuronate 4-epimerase
MNILISGCGGFIGYHLTKYLSKKYKDKKVFGFDNLNNFYSIKLKQKRIKILKRNKNFFFKKVDLNNEKRISQIFKNNNIKIVIHLAAQAGVRDSLKIPQSYFTSNFEGFINLINISKNYKIKKFIFASSSSVYGDQKKFPLKENTKIIPKNIYSATKKVNEEIGEDISKITNMKIIGLRFFTVYGSFGRPDMFIFKYLRSIFRKENFYLYNKGKNFRDYTHIDDVVTIIDKLIKKKIKNKFEIFNICSNKPIDIYKLSIFISKILKTKPRLIFKKRNKIEVIKTHGSNKKILNFLGYKIKKNIFKEIPEIINWYKENKIWKYKE